MYFLTCLFTGVVMTHGMVANSIHAHTFGMEQDDVPTSIGFLPLAHCYGVRLSSTRKIAIADLE